MKKRRKVNMTRVHFVKSARKDNPVAKKGESYYWWQFYRQKGKNYSKERPKNSQLTQSPFWSEMYDILDEIGEFNPSCHSDVTSFIDNISERIDNLRDEAQSSLDSLPEQFYDSHMLNDRIAEIESMYDEMQCIDTSSLEEAETAKDADPDNEEKEIAFEDALGAVIGDVQDVSYGGE
jgi:hypothetical protein